MNKDELRLKIKAAIKCKDKKILNHDLYNVKDDMNIHSIEYMKLFAKEHDGECLSTEYINMSTYLKWKCNKCNREWNAKPTCVITRGQWCPHCNAKNSGIPKIKFSELQEKAKLYGGECLSKESEYHNYKTKLKWKCQYGHIWFAQAGSIKHSTRWCPKCKISYGENMTRQIFENLLQVKFYQTKPDWIMNDEGNKLELDGYNEELKLAFEYNGCQHYIESKAFHKRNSSLEKQRIHDKIKHERCKEKGVLLLDIPYTVKYDKLIEYIKNLLLANNINIVNNNIQIDDKFITQPQANIKFKKKIEALHYTLLTPYRGIMNNVTLKCKHGHIFTILARSVDRNKGCPVCRGYRKDSTEEIKRKCHVLNFEFLDDEYIPSKRFNVECNICSTRFKIRHADITNNFKCQRCIGEATLRNFIKPLGYKLVSKYIKDNRFVVITYKGKTGKIVPWKLYKGDAIVFK